MPKRRNPFGECSPLQFKQHVGRKEVDLGVAQEQNMKSVYARTRDLLFSGSKKSFDTPKDANCNDIYDSEDVVMDEEPSVCSNQLHITCTGELTNASHEMKPSDSLQALMIARRGSNVSSCHCCKGEAASQDRCGFCEKSICYGCVRRCTACDADFCQLCSVMNPGDQDQHWYCQQCSYRLNPYIYWATAF